MPTVNNPTISGNYFIRKLLQSSMFHPQIISPTSSPNLFPVINIIIYYLHSTSIEPFSIHGGVLDSDRSRAPISLVADAHGCCQCVYFIFFTLPLQRLIVSMFHFLFIYLSIYYIYLILSYLSLSVVLSQPTESES